MSMGGRTNIPNPLRCHAFTGLAMALFSFLPLVSWGQVTSPALPSTSSASSPSTADLNVSPEEEIKILDAIDAQSNTPSAQRAASVSGAPSTQAAAPPVGYAPPTAPTGLSVLILKEGVYLSWDAAPATSAVTAYTVFRSTTPGGGYKKVNLKPVSSPYFLDSLQNSTSPPHNGEDYFYVVSASDSQGKTSPTSDEITVTPEGMEIPEEEASPTPTPMAEEKEIALPEKNIVNLKLPADTQLSIQGYKKIDVQLGFQNFPNRPTIGNISPEQDTTLVNQELVVNLQGKVGKNVDVNVDYSDVNRAGGVDQSKQEISIKYHGEQDSPIQEVEFGDLQLLLPNTEFAGFSKNLFGLQAKMKFDQFRLTTFFAQTKGIAETRTFTGNSVQVDTVIPDITYIPNKYFLITRNFIPFTDPATGLQVNGALPANNTEQIWVDAGTGQLNPAGPNFAGPNNAFEHWLPGRDYTIDYSTGIITFIRALSPTARVAVAYTQKSGNVPIGFNGATIDLPAGTTGTDLKVPDNGIVDNAHHLIKDSNNTTGPSSPNAIALSPLYLVDYYNLGTNKIIPPAQDPDFLFQILSNGTNNVLQTGQGVSQVGVSNPWVYNVNLDFNYLTVTNSNFLASGAPSSFLFPERPFANLDTSGGSSSSANPPDVYSQTVPPTSQFSIHLRYKTQSNNFSVGRFNIIQGSESVYLDGRRLRRDVDYQFDYTSGFLDFPDKSILRPDSQIVVSYEYAPFGSFSQNNILGARAEYDITDNFFVGSTFLESDAQQPIDVPQVGATPNSLTLFDADSRLDLSQDDVKSLTGIVPGLEDWKPPLSVRLSGEIAQSYFNPDTYTAEGENGVALLDNMEGIDSVTGASMNQTAWLVAAAPQPVGFLPGLTGSTVPDAGPDAGNNRVRFYNAGAPNNMVVFQTIGTSNGSGSGPNYTNVPAFGGHIYAQTQQPNDAVQVLQFPYSNLTNQRWAGLRQVISTTGTDFSNVTYMETWVYNDGKPKWIMVDFGVMNEAANGELAASAGSSFFSDPNQYSQPQTVANPNYGIPTFYYPGNPWSPSGSVSSPVNYLISPEQTSQEGVSVGQNTSYVTEDMNGNNFLDPTDGYYEYGIQANWNGWHQVKIPVNFTAADGMNSTPDGTTYFFHTQGQASPSIIRTIRVWMTGQNASPINGDVYFEDINFAHNLWQLQVDPTANINQGVTVNTAKFDVNSISQDQNPSYVPTLRFLTVQQGQDQSAILFKEKALEVTYNLSSADFQPSGDINGSPIYYATRIFNQGLDLTDYQDLRFDLYLRSYQPGDVLFVRVGNDQQDYYQYNVQLSAAAVTCLNTWGSVNIPLDGSGGNVQKVGTPYINRVTNVSFGVVSPNPPSGNVGDLWINNLRGANSAVRSGLARRANAAFLVGNDSKNPFATINTRYREVDSGFTQMDQTSTHFQHSKQLGGDFSSNGVSIFSQPLVTQASYTHQDLTTEDGLKANPYYLALPDSHLDNATGSISYTKDLGPSFGRLTTVRLSGSTNYETDAYSPDFLNQNQQGVLGNTHRGQETYTLASTYDAPQRFLFLPIGANQFTETYTVTHDYQGYDSNYSLANYDRITRSQTYGWTNTTEIFKNLVFTPGYTWSLVDAKGNTNSPGAPVSLTNSVSDFTPFQQRYQPKGGLVYRGIPGITPSVDYTGSNQYDYASFFDGTRYTVANTLNYTVNLTPGTWFDFFQKMNLTVTGGGTENATASIPGYSPGGALPFAQQWFVEPNYNDPFFTEALTASKSVAYQLNASFKLFDVWDFRPTGSWTHQLSLLSQGTFPVKQDSETLGITTVYNRKIFTLPLVNFNLDSAQFQYTTTDSTQYDSSVAPVSVTSDNIANETTSDLYGVTLPYDMGKDAGQGNIHFQVTTGTQKGISTLNTLVTQRDDQYSFEYDRRLAPNLDLHIPLTHWRIKLENAIELKTTFLMEFVNDQSSYINNVLQSDKYRGTIDINYNALKNLRIGIGLANEYFTNYQNHQLDYVLWQGDISAEARF